MFDKSWDDDLFLDASRDDFTPKIVPPTPRHRICQSKPKAHQKSLPATTKDARYRFLFLHFGCNPKNITDITLDKRKKDCVVEALLHVQEDPCLPLAWKYWKLYGQGNREETSVCA
jgi:hypothetical protein